MGPRRDTAGRGAEERAALHEPILPVQAAPPPAADQGHGVMSFIWPARAAMPAAESAESFVSYEELADLEKAEKLEQLESRLLEGKISEETYERLRKKFEGE